MVSAFLIFHHQKVSCPPSSLLSLLSVLLLCLLSFQFLIAGATDLFYLEKSHQLQNSENISKLTVATCISA